MSLSLGLRRMATGALLAAATAAQAGAPYDLPWPTPGQSLRYQSCGCADACWTAELRDPRAQRPLARLRCDCETLFSTVGQAAEQQAAPNCQAFEGEDKFSRIPAAMRALIAPAAASAPTR